MKLRELSFEYKEAAAACRQRAKELRESMAQCESETEKLLLRRRIAILMQMAGDAAATAKYLYGYYGTEGKQNDGRGKVSGSQTAYQADGCDGRGQDSCTAAWDERGTYAETEAACTYVLYRAEADDADCG